MAKKTHTQKKQNKKNFVGKIKNQGHKMYFQFTFNYVQLIQV